MKLKEFYREIGSSYADVTARLGNEEFVRYFVLLFKDDKSFEELMTAPVPLPLMEIVAPGRGSPSVSVTRPLM